MQENFTKQTKVRYKTLRRLIGNASRKIILDIGVGEDPISRGIKSKKILKLDILKEHKPDILCNLNKSKIPLKKESVDIIIAGEIIEHLIDPHKVIREFHRVLTPKGVLVLSTPNICSLVNRGKMLFGKIPSYSSFPVDKKNDRRHYTDYNKEILTGVLESAGFKISVFTSNGVVTHGKVILPSSLTPPSWGENFMVRAIKK